MTEIENSPNPPATLWSRLTGFLAPVLMYVVVIAIMLLFAMFGMKLATTNVAVGVLLAGIGEIAAIGFYLWLAKRHAIGWRQTLAARWPGWKGMFIGLGTGVILFLGLQAIMIVLLKMGLHVGSSTTTNEMGSLNGWQRDIFLYFFPALVAPVLEETLYRGAVFSTFMGWEMNRGRTLALSMLGNSFLFAVVHYQGFSTATDFFVLCWIFTIGMVHSFLKFRYNSVLVPMLSHITYNAITVISVIVAATH